MTDHSSSRAGPARRWGARPLLAAMLLSLLIPGTAAAGGSGSLAITGIQHEFGSCGGDGYLMTGDLEGCWWITSFESKTDESRHNVRATGTELFDGWIGSRHGTFTTTFQYTAKMDGPWVNFIEIHGRCHHPVEASSGTGDLVGISGELSFKDVVDVNPPYYPYWGSLRIAGQTLGLSSATTAATGSSATTTATALSC
jgi:hypothetical protein